ncbi:helix-turn-helix transcriptional regulator [Flavobacterium rakeshii]|uniref:Helix-turn-helix transcriptional regulator n=1 Tax=Flavobacterium rakeshii TaxID=1038845 RepID=A0A6N8HGB3_9FLAO|nr:helix-turn-helix transcriptional regulator [Flavobacterium rakeshii]
MLTKREKEIFNLLVNEYQTTEIAKRLDISPHTVSSHRKNIFQKTGTNSVLQLIKLGLEKGWV